ncbi:MAG TPA: helix-turn-helix domain-containing protein [Thermomicrobiales bacterium]|nr:helix-turn-helix domain-containing protein [Thermomicrobiales bacterium]
MSDPNGSQSLDAAFCPYFHAAAELIGRRWTGAILRALLHDVRHFNEIKRSIPSLSPRMLSERLKELEAAGLIEREVIPTMPVRTEYHLTEKGRQLSPVIQAIEDWAHDWLVPDSTPSTRR